MTSKSFCFSRDEKSSYSNEERLQLAELVEQFKKDDHLKEQEALEGKTRYDRKHKKQCPVVTHVVLPLVAFPISKNFTILQFVNQKSMCRW